MRFNKELTEAKINVIFVLPRERGREREREREKTPTTKIDYQCIDVQRSGIVAAS